MLTLREGIPPLIDLLFNWLGSILAVLAYATFDSLLGVLWERVGKVIRYIFLGAMALMGFGAVAQWGLWLVALVCVLLVLR